jgi:hypothetical protein
MPRSSGEKLETLPRLSTFSMANGSHWMLRVGMPSGRNMRGTVWSISRTNFTLPLARA